MDVTPLNSDEGIFFLNVILAMAYSKLYRESGPNEMVPLALILWEREEEVVPSSLFFFFWRSVGRTIRLLFSLF